MNDLNELREEVERIREYGKEAAATVKEAAAALSELFEYVKEAFADFADGLKELSELIACIDYKEAEFSHNCVIYIADREKKREPRGKVNKITRWASRRAHPR